jgi:hypothetical protein
MEKQHLSVEEFAQLSRMSESTVRRRLKAGQLPAIQSGGPGTMWAIDWNAYAQQAVQRPKESASQGTSHPVPVHDCQRNEKIAGPQPLWLRHPGQVTQLEDGP